ncbi:MAG: AmmeMemoRadiSam system protein B [Deltaproteobacteria bacterium]|nr:AmmeMemoRadiSam system protein B [Deltaproteobacteria bacterium]
MADKNPRLRIDLEFFPIQHGNEQLILVRDSLGLVEEGKAVPLLLYEVMAQLDGTNTVRDIQMVLMRQKGGMLVGTDEVEQLLAYLDELYLLHTERYIQARHKIIAEFTARKVRPCSHCGQSYPGTAADLKNNLDEILNSQPLAPKPDTRVTALIAPHIDLSVGSRVYGSACQCLKHLSPSRVVVLGVGHQMMGDLFCLTKKDFQTPLGVVKNDLSTVQKLMDAGHSVISDNDFIHKTEHSIEFQVIFLQHLLPQDSFTIIPILCGPMKPSLSEYTRETYLKEAHPFLTVLSEILDKEDKETLLMAGVDFSHIGPKFGHDMPATYLEGQSKKHDQNLLKAVSEGDADAFWQESRRVEDKFNVCGFSAMACLLEVLPPSSNGKVLDYHIWHEEPTRSAVSFAAVLFSK